MSRYIDKDKVIEKIAWLAKRSIVGEIDEPYLDWKTVVSVIFDAEVVDVQEVNQNQCDMCNGKEASLQDRFSGYKIDIDIKRQELNIWHGDECLANIQIDYCPQCGTKLRSKK